MSVEKKNFKCFWNFFILIVFIFLTLILFLQSGPNSLLDLVLDAYLNTHNISIFFPILKQVLKNPFSNNITNEVTLSFKKIISHNTTQKAPLMDTMDIFSLKIRITVKELNFCRKLKFSHTYIFATWRWKPLIFQI